MKLYEARNNEGRIILRHNYIKHNMLAVGFSESHIQYYQLDGNKAKPVIKSTYRYYIR